MQVRGLQSVRRGTCPVATHVPDHRGEPGGEAQFPNVAVCFGLEPRSIALQNGRGQGLSSVLGEEFLALPPGRKLPNPRSQPPEVRSGQQVNVLLPGGHGVDDISSPESKTTTTVSSSRARVSKPRRSSRPGDSSSVNGSIQTAHSAAWTASSAATPCFSAPGWTLTPRNGPRRPGWLRTGSSRA